MDQDDLIPFPIIHPNPLTPPEPVEKENYFATITTTTTNNNVNSNNINHSKKPQIMSRTITNNIERRSNLINLLAAYEKPPNIDKDAGNKPLDHYKSRLPAWRYKLRNSLLPLIRWETPYLAIFQLNIRHIILDIYFVLTANLGTHTFYVLMLPAAFWFGVSDLARDLVHVLAFGVYVTGVIKDLLCLPRPLSPPLHRITMSGSAALEYGFPSTHSAHGIAVGLLIATYLSQHKDSFVNNYTIMQALNVLYVATIVFGRIYCGMHGFLDVIAGTLIGTFLWVVRYLYGPVIDSMLSGDGSSCWPLTIIPLVLLLVRIHPEPVDDCPCFDDAVAFLGTLAGVCVGEWHLKRQGVNAIPYDYNKSGLVGSVLRFLIGGTLIAIWRPTMKRTLHQALPPIFRIIERIGLSMPRKYFTPASQYEDVPASLGDSTVLEPHQFTSFLSKMTRARSDSVGPQSEADVYESLAYREYQREKERQRTSKNKNKNKDISYRGKKSVDSKEQDQSASSAVDIQNDPPSAIEDNSASQKEKNELLSTVVLPRVRYDVEVVTKLIVYFGIAMIAVDFCGLLFIGIGI